MIQERYRFHPPGAAFGVALGLGPAGLPYWRDLVPDEERSLFQWEPKAAWHPYAPDESAAELAVELLRVAGLVKEVSVVPLAALSDALNRVAVEEALGPLAPGAQGALDRVFPAADPQARATAAALGAVERALGAGKEEA